ncbi:hypothetical protein D6745_04135 [Candidatus Woesearchaeota archaeon]|nr:MAG: hypothetical protein D6745_04135 [Candidatus Woesearchaeota archaeon]
MGLSDLVKGSARIVGGLGAAVASSYYVEAHTMPMDFFGYAGIIGGAGLVFNGFRGLANKYFMPGAARVLTAGFFLGAAAFATGIHVWDKVDNDYEREVINIRNARVVPHLIQEGENPWQYFTEAYRVNNSTNNFELWLERFARENKDNPYVIVEGKGADMRVILRPGGTAYVPVLRDLLTGYESADSTIFLKPDFISKE